MKPTEQAKKLMNGCGEIEIQRYSKEIGFVDEECNKLELCPSCKKAIKELKIAFENELEKWEEIWNRNLLEKPKKEYNEGQMEFIKKQIEELKQAIKILENGK